MNTAQKKLGFFLVAAVTPVFSFAASTWQMWDNTAPVACTTANTTAMGNSYSCAAVVGTDPTMKVSALATTASGARFEDASVRRWDWTPTVLGTPIAGQTSGYDYGVVNNGGPSAGNETTSGGQHSMDNNGFTDLMALDFGPKSIALTSVSVGWVQEDADISVLRYTLDTSSGTLADTVKGKSIAELLTGGWELVGHYASLQNDLTAPSRTAEITGAGSSSWWLVSAYNSAFGAGTNTYGGSTSGLGNSNDYVKLLQVAGNVKTYDTPEPSSLALLAVGLVGVMASRRKKDTASAL